MTIKEGSALPLGVSIKEGEINFSFETKNNKNCELLLYKKGAKAPFKQIKMNKSTGNLWTIALDGIESKDLEYNYLADDTIMVDPYGKEIVGRAIWNEEEETDGDVIRAKAALPAFDWEEDEMPQIPHNKVIGYSLHVRGFTKHVSSKVKNKGTFEGVLEKLNYIKELGVNQIQCMPVYDFFEKLRYTNYWGYGKGYYFAPKGAYSAGESPSLSLKEMVKSMHKNGIEVVLEMPFSQEISYGFMLECLRYYVLEYHIDGFIVNPSLIPVSELEKDPVLGNTKILIHDTRFQNTIRRFLKGDEAVVIDVMGEMTMHGDDKNTFNYITNQNGFTLMDLVSYDGKHNEANGENNSDGPEYNYSWNCGVEGKTRKKAVLELRDRQIKNAFSLVLLSKGMVSILAGDEFGNTQEGNNNVYCQDNATSWLNWNLMVKNEERIAFVKELIGLRKKSVMLYKYNSAGRQGYYPGGAPEISFHGEQAWQAPTSVASRILGIYYHNEEKRGKSVYMAFNMHWSEHEFALPGTKKGKWCLIADTNTGILEKPLLLKEQKYLKVEERSVKVLLFYE